MAVRRRLAYAAAVAAVCLASTLGAQDPGWPREIAAAKGTITIYQPQPETFKGDVLTGRAAISILPKGKTDPVFGALWFTSHLTTDRDARTAVIRDVKITRVRWPGATDATQAEFSAIVEGAFPKDGMEIQLDRLTASLATAEREQKSADALKNDPPVIVFSSTLAELLLYDGEPRTIAITGTKLEQVANAAFAVIKDPASGTYYLAGGKIWYSAKSPKGPWAVIAKPPAEVAKLVPADTSSTPAPKVPPKIIVATVPTELIVTDGAPKWTPIGKGELLYVQNTESPIIRDVAGAKVYILVTGRWYQSASMDGPWTFVRPDKLPVAFKTIPPASEIGGVRVSVAGTDEAEDALLDAAIPQTAAISRSSAKLTVTYDGVPAFTAVTGTAVAYATNTATQVLRIDGKFYAVDNGVWFASSSATGPWVVADKIPDAEIAKIPPSAPVYNVTYVHVYESTPDVVYVGYTPGYMYSYPYYGVPVYGTGYYYPPYWGAVYYPRPVTYGMHVGYNPYTGWNVGFSWSVGFMTVGVGFGGHGGYYGPGGYHGHGGGCFNCNINIGNNVNVGNRPATKPAGGRNNLYGNSNNTSRVADRGTTTRNASPALGNTKAPGKANDVFADRDGNVKRNTGSGWDSREGNSWKPSGGSAGAGARPSTGASTRPSPSASSGMDRDYSARNRGASRAASAPRASRGGGGRR